MFRELFGIVFDKEFHYKVKLLLLWSWMFIKGDAHLNFRRAEVNITKCSSLSWGQPMLCTCKGGVPTGICHWLKSIYIFHWVYSWGKENKQLTLQPFQILFDIHWFKSNHTELNQLAMWITRQCEWRKQHKYNKRATYIIFNKEQVFTQHVNSKLSWVSIKIVTT